MHSRVADTLRSVVEFALLKVTKGGTSNEIFRKTSTSTCTSCHTNDTFDMTADIQISLLQGNFKWREILNFFVFFSKPQQIKTTEF